MFAPTVEDARPTGGGTGRAASARLGRKAARIALALMLLAPAALPLGGCRRQESWHSTDISGAVPDLQLAMVRANDGRHVNAADYRGKVVLLYFGYTFCPDVCPLTLSNVARVLKRLGPPADGVRVLFVTVDPGRDVPDVLKQYVAAFDPHVDGLRGDPNQLAALARRYRVAYSVDPHGAGGRYEVTHSSIIYAFDGTGRARLMISTLSTGKPDIDGTASDLRALLRQSVARKGG
ncbi:MAG TPA: SCO family protein [Allosphingosinicella sp.]|nr:SCO family protein [Allosphingosinicella sp.]